MPRRYCLWRIRVLLISYSILLGSESCPSAALTPTLHLDAVRRCSIYIVNMDGASSIAGLLGLAVLTAQTTAKMVNALKTLKKLPDDLRKLLEWLEQLHSLLQAIYALPPQTLIVDTEFQQLFQHVQTASNAVAHLSARVSSMSASLNDSSGVKKQTEKVKIHLDTKRLNKDTEDVRQAIECLHLCLSQISTYMLPSSSIFTYPIGSTSNAINGLRQTKYVPLS